MEIKTKSTRMHSLVSLCDMHSDYYVKAIDGISDKDAQNRLDTKANHIAWIAGSMLQERFEMTNLLTGSELKPSSYVLFKNHQGIQDNAAYPPLSDYKNDWEKITPLYREALLNITDEKLDSIFKIPEMSMPYYDFVVFMAYREANCIGQIILWRRLLGYPGIKYD